LYGAGDLFDFDYEVEPILEVLMGKVLEQGLMEVRRREGGRLAQLCLCCRRASKPVEGRRRRLHSAPLCA